MQSDLAGENCFICCQKSVHFHNTSSSELNICHIICQHFWFKEDDLRSTIVCGICWEKMDQFHQFYLDVQKLHGQLEAAPVSIFVKQEETEIEVDLLQKNSIELPVDDQKPFDIVDCKLELPEECNELMKEELSQEPRKKLKNTRRPQGKRVAKRKDPHSRKLLPSDKRKAEDDFIKQHTSYFCKECNMEFESFRDIKRHQINTHNKKNVVCCGNLHRSRSILYQHVQNVLNPEAMKCEICSHVFKSKNGWLRHKANHTAGKYPDSRKLLTPEEQQAEDDFIKLHTFYFCEECNMEFENFKDIKRHRINTHKKKSVVCCGTQYSTRALLYQHVQNALNPEAFKCEICSNTFKSQSGYLRHKKENHAALEESVFKCHRCEKSFTKEVSLKSHLMGHETLENGTAKCEFCGKCFRHQMTMKKHVKAVHQKPTDFICEVCSKGFHRRAVFLAHRKTHELTAEQLRKQCPVCNKWMKNHTYWLKHVRRHKENGKEHKCEMCAHVSISAVALKMHMSRRHAPDRKLHVCNLCGKEYSSPTTLREHVANAHTGEPLYQCQYCEKKFFSNATMYSHRKKEHPQEWLEDHLAKYATSDSREDGSSETIS